MNIFQIHGSDTNEKTGITTFIVTMLCAVISLLTLSVPAHAEFDPIMAAAMSDSSEPVAEATDTTDVRTDLDPIETYALAGFSKQKKMLADWQYDAASFDKLMGYLDKGELFKDSNNVYLQKNKEYFDYKTNAKTTWKPSIEQVMLNNQLRSVVTLSKAKINLSSDDVAKRKAAVKAMSDSSDDISIDFINEQLAKQKDADVKAGLTTLLARKQLQDSSLADEVLIKAVDNLESSDDPNVLALLGTVKDGDDYSKPVKKAAASAFATVESRIDRLSWFGHIFSGLSVASILLLAALGLAITYGLLGVINMAHGELIMIGAYATYVTQQMFAKYMPDAMGWYLVAAIPVAFLVSALVGVIIERVVVKPLYGRQLETLLATFGVSLVLIQLTRFIFGPQNVAVEATSWLSGGVQLSSSIILPYNRIAVIVFTLLVLLLVKLLISYTRFGLFVRAVTQNRPMARAVGVNSSKIDMMAFGLGSGVAGLAGCALAQIGNVGPDLGQSYIVDTFLVVVVGGVGQLAGAALAALGLGVGGTVLEVGIGAVMAKIILLGLVILFIQKRPQGLFAVKGRFVE